MGMKVRWDEKGRRDVRIFAPTGVLSGTKRGYLQFKYIKRKKKKEKKRNLYQAKIYGMLCVGSE